MQALEGFVLIVDGETVGFCYSVAEEDKGLVGDLFILPKFRTGERENLLLEATLRNMWRAPGLNRVEAQLLMLSDPLSRQVPDRSWFQAFEREFLELRMDRIDCLPSRDAQGARITGWSDSRQDDAARLIALSYKGHIDAQINDQYRSPAGARRFLTNIVQYPGCGAFYAPASFVALDRIGQGLCGICLASMVSDEAGHITQVCVSPAHRGSGLGYELVRRSLSGLADRGARTVSLTVTGANSGAIRLYRNMGFETTRNFAAYVWEKP